MTDILARLAIGATSIAATVYIRGLCALADSGRLCASPRPSPFHLRWVLPAVLRHGGPQLQWCARHLGASEKVVVYAGEARWRWAAATYLGLLASCVLFPGDLWACALWAAMPWFEMCARAPILVDAPAIALALAAPRARGLWGLALGVLAAGVSEKAPVFGGLFAWRWDIAAAGLVAVLVASWAVPHAPRAGQFTATGVGRYRAPRLRDLHLMLMIWGAGAAALIGPWTLRELVVVGVAYAQLGVAFDTVRMIQWAAPVVLPRAMAVIPLNWRAAAVVLTWLNPVVARANQNGALC